MKLNFAIICDNAFTDEVGRLNIIQTFDVIFAPNFPAIHPRLSIVTNYALEEKDKKDEEYKQTLTIINSSAKEPIISLENVVTPKVGKERNIQYITNIVGLSFPVESVYEVSARVNGKDFGKVVAINVDRSTAKSN
ncbi:hypothetical protein GYA37_03855 [candidate division WWE3 bacterium]|uniref:Uncharacterized protein n=1 Tax=candidate division WWE3 bacterium TaxID=2053526 RepID=A0A7X9E7I4_UNCKA|nr:hypothetical protein [candidate division WWE3 bacterium]